jgi:hypothetical protein
VSRRAVAAIVAASLFVGLALGAPSAEAATAGIGAVSFTGENGTLSGGSGVSATVNNSASKRGNRGLMISSTNARSYVNWGVPSGHRYAALRLWVRVLRRGSGESVDLVTLQNSQGKAHFDLFVNGRNQRLMWDLYRDDADSTSAALTYNRWYLVEALVEFDGSEHTAQVRIDGVNQGTIRSSGTTSTVRQLTVGSASNKTHTQHYDDVVLRVGDAPLSWAAAPV